jgi:hypothetical protein
LAGRWLNGIAVDLDGNVAVVGQFIGTMDVGDGPMTSAGGSDAFVVLYSASGQHLCSNRFGNGSDQYAMSVAFDPWGDIAMTGVFKGKDTAGSFKQHVLR